MDAIFCYSIKFLDNNAFHICLPHSSFYHARQCLPHHARQCLPHHARQCLPHHARQCLPHHARQCLPRHDVISVHEGSEFHRKEGQDVDNGGHPQCTT